MSYTAEQAGVCAVECASVLWPEAPQRRYGYHVLPFLWRDRIVGCADLEAERGDGLPCRQGAPRGAGVRRSRALDEAFDRLRPAPTHHGPRARRAMRRLTADMR
jgi:hypothetical protein